VQGCRRRVLALCAEPIKETAYDLTATLTLCSQAITTVRFYALLVVTHAPLTSPWNKSNRNNSTMKTTAQT
jgi:hypothetical protein